MASHAFSTRDVLGLAPRRQMNAARFGETATMARIDRALAAMREVGRRAVLIVDNKCGDGRLLIRAARRARALGFVAVEALGFDRSAERIAAARTAARRSGDPRIRLDFALRAEAGPLPLDDDADLLLADPDEDPPSELDRLTHPTGAIIEHR